MPRLDGKVAFITGGGGGIGGWFGFGSSSKWTDADVRRAFHKYDSNSSGKLDYKELRGALQDLGLRHDTDEAVRVLTEGETFAATSLEPRLFQTLVHGG